MCAIEMVARSSKEIYKQRMRSAASLNHHHQQPHQLAQVVQSEMVSIVCELFQQLLGVDTERQRFWNELLCGLVKQKFNCDLPSNEFSNIHKPALFHSLQYHASAILIYVTHVTHVIKVRSGV